MEKGDGTLKSGTDMTQVPSFGTAQPTSFIPPLYTQMPAEFVDWLLKDLSRETVEKIISQPLFQKKIKGIHKEILQKEQVVALLSEEFHGNLTFRTHIGILWKEQRKERLRALYHIPTEELLQDYQPLLKKFGVAPLYWFCVYSVNARIQELALRIAREYGLSKEDGSVVMRSEQRLRGELESVSSAKKTLEAQIQSEKESSKKFKEEIIDLKTKVRSLERELEKEKQAAGECSNKIVEQEKKINSLSGADQMIRALEKKNRSYEHDLDRARQSVQELEKKIKCADDEKEHFMMTKIEMEKTIHALYAIFKPLDNSAIDSKKESQQTAKVILVIGADKKLPLDYYNCAASAGVILHYHAGFKHDMEIEKKLSESDRILLFFPEWDEINRCGDLIGYLRKNELPFLLLPQLSPQAFLSLVQNRFC